MDKLQLSCHFAEKTFGERLRRIFFLRKLKLLFTENDILSKIISWTGFLETGQICIQAFLAKLRLLSRLLSRFLLKQEIFLSLFNFQLLFILDSIIDLLRAKYFPLCLNVAKHFKFLVCNTKFGKQVICTVKLYARMS